MKLKNCRIQLLYTLLPYCKPLVINKLADVVLYECRNDIHSLPCTCMAMSRNGSVVLESLLHRDEALEEVFLSEVVFGILVEVGSG